MRLTKKMSLLVLPFAVMFLFCGCSKLSKTSKPDTAILPYDTPQYQWDGESGVTLTLWSQEPEMDRIYMQRAIQNYEETTGNRIELVQIPQNEFLSKVQSAFSNQSDAPDLLLSYGGTNIDSFDPDLNFYDFTDAVWVDDLTDTSINQSIYHGKVIGLPHWEASVSGTLYNKELFEKYHIEVPKNQEEFLAVCETLLSHKITPLYLPFQNPSMMLYQFPLDTLVEDSEVLHALNDGLLGYRDLPEMKTVVEWYRLMAERGYFGTDFTENSWSGMNDALESGTYAMMLGWDTWLYTDFKGDASKFGLMPAFIGIPDEGTFEGPNLSLIMVNKNSEKLDSALNFVTFLADPYHYNQAFYGIYTAPVFKHQSASISTPQYAEAERNIERSFHDSIAWLRIRGFSQNDASCILDFITSDGSITAEECLEAMDQLRLRRIQP